MDFFSRGEEHIVFCNKIKGPIFMKEDLCAHWAPCHILMFQSDFKRCQQLLIIVCFKCPLPTVK